MLKDGDAAAIQRAIAAYGVAIDGRALDLFDTCFTSDAWMEMGGERLTIPAYRDRCERAFELFPIMQHQFGLPFISVGTDRIVRARTPFVAYHARYDTDEGLVIGGEYGDCFTRVGERDWRIASRQGIARWHKGDISMLAELKNNEPQGRLLERDVIPD